MGVCTKERRQEQPRSQWTKIVRGLPEYRQLKQIMSSHGDNTVEGNMDKFSRGVERALHANTRANRTSYQRALSATLQGGITHVLIGLTHIGSLAQRARANPDRDPHDSPLPPRNFGAQEHDSEVMKAGR
jgi:hypothetical protein